MSGAGALCAVSQQFPLKWLNLRVPTHPDEGIHPLKPNYQFAKRQRDLAKKQKKEEKRKRKMEAAASTTTDTTDAVEGSQQPPAVENAPT
jgi:hypothetical protein